MLAGPCGCLYEKSGQVRRLRFGPQRWWSSILGWFIREFFFWAVLVGLEGCIPGVPAGGGVADAGCAHWMVSWFG